MNLCWSTKNKVKGNSIKAEGQLTWSRMSLSELNKGLETKP